MIFDLLYAPDGPFTIAPPPDWWALVADDLKAPFPWFGGKSKVAHLVWDRFGEVKNYCEPFYATGAVLLGRPHEPVIETVNDYDGYVVNFWRAIQAPPAYSGGPSGADLTAQHADWPVSEMDLHARHKWLVERKDKLRARLLEDPTFYDARIAGWWVWGLCAWIGSGWCVGYGIRKDATPKEQLPHLSGSGSPGHGQGINGKGMRLSKQLPDLGGGFGDGRGVHNKAMRSDGQLPAIGTGGGYGLEQGKGVHNAANRSRLSEVFRALAKRLRYVRITCGDFERILSPAVTWRHGTTGVFLDPPYPGDAGSTGGIYSTEAHERETFDRTSRYCIENGGNKDLRIALCYYEGTKVAGVDVSEHLRAVGWDVVPWKAGGGYGGQSGTNQNASRERIAFSPHCLKARQRSLFT